MKIGKYISVFIGLFSFYYSSCQEYVDSATEMNKYNISLETGIIYMNYGKGLNQFSNYYFPAIHYNLKQKFRFELGIMQLNQLYNNFLDESSSESQFHPHSTYFVGSGNYLLNNKVSIYGKIIKQVDNIGTSYSLNPALQDYSFGINYSIIPNLNVGVEFRQSINNYNYYYPFH